MNPTKYLISTAVGSAVVLAFAGIAAAATVVSFSDSESNVSCPVVTSFMKIGIANNKADVTRLQQFLKGMEKADVDVTGMFDQKTEDAVKAFQKKHADEILTPWGATRASGMVYVTTGKKINQVACNQVMTLDQKELKTISGYLSAGQAMIQAAAGPVPVAMAATSATSTPLSVDLSAGEDQTASAADASLIGRFWWYLKNAF